MKMAVNSSASLIRSLSISFLILNKLIGIVIVVLVEPVDMWMINLWERFARTTGSEPRRMPAPG